MLSGPERKERRHKGTVVGVSQEVGRTGAPMSCQWFSGDGGWEWNRGASRCVDSRGFSIPLSSSFYNSLVDWRETGGRAKALGPKQHSFPPSPWPGGRVEVTLVGV